MMMPIDQPHPSFRPLSKKSLLIISQSFRFSVSFSRKHASAKYNSEADALWFGCDAKQSGHKLWSRAAIAQRARAHRNLVFRVVHDIVDVHVLRPCHRHSPRPSWRPQLLVHSGEIAQQQKARRARGRRSRSSIAVFWKHAKHLVHKDWLPDALQRQRSQRSHRNALLARGPHAVCHKNACVRISTSATSAAKAFQLLQHLLKPRTVVPSTV